MKGFNMDFSGKVVLVTGASRGIGREIARQFAEKGAKVAVHYNSNRAAAEESLNMLSGDGHRLYQADIADATAVKTLVDSVVSDMGSLDVLVNNAAIYSDHPIAEVSYDEWQRQWLAIIQTNLIAAANLCYWAAQYMIPSGGGKIINVSSRGAFRGEPTSPAYGASKAALNALGQSLAVALGVHGISIMTVAPGWVETDMAKETLAGPMGDAVRKQSPMGRVAQPQDVAAAVVFFASDEAAFMTGAILDINGASYL
jgi:NAD(P)-dependent dehydrogenase (short-subunit alcohol dehydrogenase family)